MCLHTKVRQRHPLYRRGTNGITLKCCKVSHTLSNHSCPITEDSFKFEIKAIILHIISSYLFSVFLWSSPLTFIIIVHIVCMMYLFSLNSLMKVLIYFLYGHSNDGEEETKNHTVAMQKQKSLNYWNMIDGSGSDYLFFFLKKSAETVLKRVSPVQIMMCITFMQQNVMRAELLRSSWHDFICKQGAWSKFSNTSFIFYL